MSILVIAEHDNEEIKASTNNVVTAATNLEGDIHVLVAGSNCSGAKDQAAKISGVAKVLVADSPEYEHCLAENIADLIVAISADYSHILSPATTNGKNYMPRVSALLDVAQISDITAIESSDTFERPIYAGNCIATVQNSDSKKVITVRTTAFDAAQNERKLLACNFYH